MSPLADRILISFTDTASEGPPESDSPQRISFTQWSSATLGPFRSTKYEQSRFPSHGHVLKVCSRPRCPPNSHPELIAPSADIFLDLRKRFEAEAEFASRKDTPRFVEYEFVDYPGMLPLITSIESCHLVERFPGTTHGFASRPNLKHPEIREAHEKALQQTIAWFKKTLV